MDRNKRVRSIVEKKAPKGINRVLTRCAIILVTMPIVFWIQGAVFIQGYKTAPVATGIGVVAMVAMLVSGFFVIKNSLMYAYYTGIVSYLEAQVEVGEAEVRGPDLKLMKEENNDGTRV